MQYGSSFRNCSRVCSPASPQQLRADSAAFGSAEDLGSSMMLGRCNRVPEELFRREGRMSREWAIALFGAFCAAVIAIPASYFAFRATPEANRPKLEFSYSTTDRVDGEVVITTLKGRILNRSDNPAKTVHVRLSGLPKDAKITTAPYPNQEVEQQGDRREIKLELLPANEACDVTVQIRSEPHSMPPDYFLRPEGTARQGFDPNCLKVIDRYVPSMQVYDEYGNATRTTP